MALTVTTDLTVITTAETATGWTIFGSGGGGVLLEPDFFVQGSNSVSRAVSGAATLKGGTFLAGTLNFTTTHAGKLIYMWLRVNTAQLIDLRANGGLRIVIGSGVHPNVQWPADLQSNVQWPEREQDRAQRTQPGKPARDGSILYELIGEHELGDRQKQDRVSALFDLVDESVEKREAIRKVAVLPKTFTLAEVRAIVSEALAAQQARLAAERAAAAPARNANLVRTLAWGGLFGLVLGVASSPLFLGLYALSAVAAAQADTDAASPSAGVAGATSAPRFGPPRVAPMRAPSAETRVIGATLSALGLIPQLPPIS